MQTDTERLRGLMWATRGRTWGFRLLLTAGLREPLCRYELAFDAVGDNHTAFARTDGAVAVRFPDPEGRRDEAGRVIPHEFVLLDGFAPDVWSGDDALRKVWPTVSAAYADIWDTEVPPSADVLDL